MKRAANAAPASTRVFAQTTNTTTLWNADASACLNAATNNQEQHGTRNRALAKNSASLCQLVQVSRLRMRSQTAHAHAQQLLAQMVRFRTTSVANA